MLGGAVYKVAQQDDLEDNYSYNTTIVTNELLFNGPRQMYYKKREREQYDEYVMSCAQVVYLFHYRNVYIAYTYTHIHIHIYIYIYKLLIISTVHY